MTKLSVQPVDAVIAFLIARWGRNAMKVTLKEATAANGMDGNVLKADDFRMYKPKGNRTAFIVVGQPSLGLTRNYGSYSHAVNKHPIIIEIHSVRSDKEVEAWKDEVWEIVKTVRKTTSYIGSGYRKVWLLTPPMDVSAKTNYKWVITIELEQNMEQLP
jgi:hypothetical protein